MPDVPDHFHKHPPTDSSRDASPGPAASVGGKSRQTSGPGIIREAHARARVLLDALERDALALRSVPGDSPLAEGAALCERAAEDARRLIAEIEAQLAEHPDPTSENERPHP